MKIYRITRLDTGEYWTVGCTWSKTKCKWYAELRYAKNAISYMSSYGEYCVIEEWDTNFSGTTHRI